MAEFTSSDVFLVDFNNVAERGRLIRASLRRAPQGWSPEVGRRVFLQDDDGNSCWSVVARVDKPMIYFEPDDSTWVSESSEVSGVPSLMALA
jgi:hypothetical protein